MNSLGRYSQVYCACNCLIPLDIEVVHRYNSVFLEKLQEKVSRWDPFSGKLSDAFLMIVRD